jgi:uncharacterized protein (DUF2141 family)
MVIELLIALGLSSGVPPAEASGTKLVVKVTNLPSKHGRLRCALFDGGKGFPDDVTHAKKRLSVSPHSPVCVFEDVAAGWYAVSVLHDANNNGELDTNFVGFPSEAYGASNNVLPATSAPRWEDSKFEISKEATTKTIVVELED